MFWAQYVFNYIYERPYTPQGMKSEYTLKGIATRLAPKLAPHRNPFLADTRHALLSPGSGADHHHGCCEAPIC